VQLRSVLVEVHHRSEYGAVRRLHRKKRGGK
jgi:hypothetical protein